MFGRRLQAQVVKKGDRVVMEVEITGTPDPEVTWWKDDEPLMQSEYRMKMKRQGNSYYLLIDKGEDIYKILAIIFQFLKENKKKI